MNRFKVALVAIFNPCKFKRLFIENGEELREAKSLMLIANREKEAAFAKWATSDFNYHNDPVPVKVELMCNYRDAALYCTMNNIEITRKRKS